jgi:hypothetical protein
MSAITETEPGGEMVCIIAFSARPRDSDNRPLAGPRKEFRVGERVRFLGSFFKDSPADNPTGYMAIFEPPDGEGPGRFAAAQNYFVSLDCWAGLERHFRGRASGKDGSGPRAEAAQKAGFTGRSSP